MSLRHGTQPTHPALLELFSGIEAIGEVIPVCAPRWDSDTADSVSECCVEDVFKGSLSDVTSASRVWVAAGQSTQRPRFKAFTRAGIPALSATTTLPAKPRDLQCLAIRSLDVTIVIFSSNGVTLWASRDHK